MVLRVAQGKQTSGGIKQIDGLVRQCDLETSGGGGGGQRAENARIGCIGPIAVVEKDVLIGSLKFKQDLTTHAAGLIGENEACVQTMRPAIPERGRIEVRGE